MRVVVIGDVGVADGMMHIGDEAMFEAMVEALRVRGASEVVGISAAPSETAARYGIEAVPRIGFAGPRAEMASRLAAVVSAAEQGSALGPEDPARAVIDAVRSADGVVIAGGGNLASNWTQHIFERAALGAIASRLGAPVVVSGQTLGPRLEPDDRDLVGALLRSARLVGVREHASSRMAAELGVRAESLAANRDDASFLGFDDEGARTRAPMLLVSLSSHLGGLPRGPIVSALARALESLADRAELEVVFHAHFGPVASAVAAGDEVLHDAIRAEMRIPSIALPTGDPRSAAALARSATMLVTSRYHPAVFAAPAGVPIAALTVDAYTDVKLRGATGWWGQDGVLDLATVSSPVGDDRLAAAWASGDAVRASADRDRPGARAAMSAWFDRVADEVGR